MTCPAGLGGPAGRRVARIAVTSVVLPVRQHEHLRALFGDHVAEVAKVASRDEPAHHFSACRLVALEGAPPHVVEPLPGKVTHIATRFEVTAVPELDGCRAVPLAIDVETDSEGVLDGAVAEADIGPAPASQAPV